MSTLGLGTHPSGHAAISASFELDGALTVSRNLGILASRLPLFQRRAIGTLRRRLPVEARRDIQDEYNISAGRVAKDLRSAVTAEGVTLTGYFRGIGLRNFGARPTQKGVTASIFRGQRRLRTGAFLAPLFRGSAASGNDQVVRRGSPKREMTAGRYKGRLREPLVTQYGPTVAQMLGKGRRPERLADFARGVLRDDIERQIEGYAQGRPIPGADNGETP
jgi:hypothetical protein